MDELSWWERFRQEEGRKAERRRQQAAEKQAQRERLQALPPLPRRAVPRPWEDLASVLSRTARVAPPSPGSTLSDQSCRCLTRVSGPGVCSVGTSVGA